MPTEYFRMKRFHKLLFRSLSEELSKKAKPGEHVYGQGHGCVVVHKRKVYWWEKLMMHYGCFCCVKCEVDFKNCDVTPEPLDNNKKKGKMGCGVCRICRHGKPEMFVVRN